MNICFYHSSFTEGGIARTVALIGNELAKIPEYHITSLCHSSLGEEDIYPTSFEVTYIYDRRFPMKDAILKDHYIKKVSDYLEEKKIDLLVVCGSLYAPAAAIAGRKIHMLFWLHTSPYIGTDYRFQKIGNRIGFNSCDGIVAITEKTKSILEKQYPRKFITCIYNMADERLFSLDSVYDPDAMKVIAVGRLTYQKNFQSMIRIASSLRKELPELKWHLYGEGDDRIELEAMIKENRLEDVFILKGQCTDLYERYNDYSAIVMTSRYEGFPMTLIEAAACGLPMLSYDVNTGPSEIISNGENGFLCPEGAEDEMKQNLIRFFSDRELRCKMSENSRSTAQKLRRERITAQWVDVISRYKS